MGAYICMDMQEKLNEMCCIICGDQTKNKKFRYVTKSQYPKLILKVFFSVF